MKNTKLITRVISILTLALIGMTLVSSAAWAHEQRNVSNYSLEVGFFVEPAIEGQMNGLDLRVTNTTTQQPVTDLEKTLQVEITCVSAKASRTFAIQPVEPDGDPGHLQQRLHTDDTRPVQFPCVRDHRGNQGQ